MKSNTCARSCGVRGWPRADRCPSLALWAEADAVGGLSAARAARNPLSRPPRSGPLPEGSRGVRVSTVNAGRQNGWSCLWALLDQGGRRLGRDCERTRRTARANPASAVGGTTQYEDRGLPILAVRLALLAATGYGRDYQFGVDTGSSHSIRQRLATPLAAEREEHVMAPAAAVQAQKPVRQEPHSRKASRSLPACEAGHADQATST